MRAKQKVMAQKAHPVPMGFRGRGCGDKGKFGEQWVQERGSRGFCRQSW